jgi:hypothetical protein
MSIKFSFEKEEKVVNPPHTPTIKKRRKSTESKSHLQLMFPLELKENANKG